MALTPVDRALLQRCLTRQPGAWNDFVDRFLGLIYRLVPKIGPLKPLAFEPTTAETEEIFVRSLEETIARYRAFVADAAAGTLVLDDLDLDSGRRVAWGESRRTERTYARLLEELARNGLDRVPPATRGDILAYFDASDGTPPESVKAKRWRETLVLVERLRGAEASVRSSGRAAAQTR